MAPGVKSDQLMMDPSLVITSATTEDGGACHNVKNDDYQSQFTGVVRELFLDESMLDVTLCAAGHKIMAHRMVLGACSNLFQELLSHTNEEQTIFIPEVNPEHLQAIVLFCYNGEIRVPATEITDLLNLAQHLKIEGLREVAGLVESDASNDQDEEEPYILQDLDTAEDEDSDTNNDSSFDYSPRKNSEGNTIKRRKSVCKKEYTDEQLASAIEDIRTGTSLQEACSKHNIPRSTLYMRTKTLGIKIKPTRFVYTIDDMKGAIKDVAAGCSLQQAADNHGIPKTVLWRRIQKEGINIPRREKRRIYCSDKRQAAVKALERGEALSKVATEYQIPKTTLFRDKTRLIHQGKLPTSFWKKRKSDGEDEKQSRLEEAIAACKDGKMSQAAASVTYQIPKTTIWRRLQKEVKSGAELPPHIKTRRRLQRELPKDTDVPNIKAEDLNDEEFEPYCPDETEMDIVYIDEDNMGSDPVIILASEDVDDLNLQDRQDLVVHEGTSDNFISCEIENYDENSSFSKS